MLTKILIKTLALIAFLAEREAAAAAVRDAKFKRKQAARAKTLEAEALRISSKLSRLNGEASRCRVNSALGDNRNHTLQSQAAGLAAGCKAVCQYNVS